MDWKLEQKKQEKMKVTKKTGGDKSINMMVAMEREFAHIFGAGSNAEPSVRRGKPGDHVRRSELVRDPKHSSG
jgi:hypothetical protein